VGSVQGYVDTSLGGSSLHSCCEVEADQAFAERPLGLQAAPAIVS